MTPEQIAKGRTKAQRAMLVASEPGAWGNDELAIGVEIRGAQYRTARTLEKLGLGDHTHGSPFGDLYFNNSLGLEVRAILEANNERG